jgi:hypothetical protein
MMLDDLLYTKMSNPGMVKKDLLLENHTIITKAQSTVVHTAQLRKVQCSPGWYNLAQKGAG